LLALVEHAHFGRAAQSLNISQPALTKSIQALEAELGVTLIDRKRGAVALTAFGNLVAQRSKSMLSADADLRREIALLAGYEIGSLKLALGPYPSVISGYPGIARMLARHPKISITAHVAGWRDVANQVTSRTVDLGIAELSGVQDNEQFVTELIGQHRGYHFCRPGHPILGRGHVSLTQLLEFPWVAPRIPFRALRSLPPSLGAAGTIDPLNDDFVPAIEIDVPMQLAKFLESSDALAVATLTIMQRELGAGEVVVAPTTGLELQSGYGFIYLKNRSLTPAALAYMQEVRSVEAEISNRETALADQYIDT
jgi:DNA-binding transcriptional LysR family regulator